jgi:hypothetical protein
MQTLRNVPDSVSFRILKLLTTQLALASSELNMSNKNGIMLNLEHPIMFKYGCDIR